MTDKIQETAETRGLISLREEMLAELERLRQIMEGCDYNAEEDYNNLSEEEKEIFDNFLESYSKCPICNESNHKGYLMKFYLDSSPDKIQLKEKLLKLMKESKNFDEIYYNKISLGIPCCMCFNEVFEKY